MLKSNIKQNKANIKWIQYKLLYIFHCGILKVNPETHLPIKTCHLNWFVNTDLKWSLQFPSSPIALTLGSTDPRPAVDYMRLYSATSLFLLWDILYTQYLSAVMIRLQKHLNPNKQTLETDVSRVQTVVIVFARRSSRESLSLSLANAALSPRNIKHCLSICLSVCRNETTKLQDNNI